MGMGPALSFDTRGSFPTGTNEISFAPKEPTTSYP